MASNDHAPPFALYVSEPLRALSEYGLLLAAQPLMKCLPEGDGYPVLVLPGLLADDASTRALRRRLRGAGYRVHGWQLGRNLGPTAKSIDGMSRRLEDLRARYGVPVSIVGWSLGGIFARNLARRTPGSVRQVITLGSPFRLAHVGQTRAQAAYDRFTHLHAEHGALPLEAHLPDLPVPTTSIYSRYDGIVDWRACLNPRGDRCENIGVIASHLGIGHHPAALWAIADRLAQPEGSWTPFRPPKLYRHAYPRPPQAYERCLTQAA